ncbi:MAG: type III pantothenate kinase [Gammaproteobacteria bacterium]|nr:type III pantothenate kinase [Gammaproteobacteria bacterium]MDP2142219.1 type III pantothenate kinase [Gammaproteobacteria bacterium]MDP2347868.1 type III pantothenate kinase [Gammaproteobacteria bacterium]
MILDIDVGNSRLKWRLSHGDGGIVQRGSCADESEFGDVDLVGGLQRVRIANVRGESVVSMLNDICRKRWHLTPEFAQPVHQCAGVTNAYQKPETLGVDRWLAVLAAYNDCRGACCVVDAGSAATFDVMTANGQHLGGYIVPGLSLQKRSLLESTGIRMVKQNEWPEMLQPGTDTALAVHGGIVAMMVAWVQYVYRLAAGDTESILYLTGGDAMLLSIHLDRCGISHRVAPDLVLDGLASALP